MKHIANINSGDPDSTSLNRTNAYLQMPRAKKKEEYTIFLVEDSRDDQELIIRTLRRSPMIKNVHCFNNGDCLFDMFREKGFYNSDTPGRPPALILLDINLPGANGLEILRLLKAHYLTEDIPVIVISHDMTESKIAQAYEYRANGFIPKPVRLDHIHEVISTGSGWPVRGKTH